MSELQLIYFVAKDVFFDRCRPHHRLDLSISAVCIFHQKSARSADGNHLDFLHTYRGSRPSFHAQYYGKKRENSLLFVPLINDCVVDTFQLPENQGKKQTIQRSNIYPRRP